MDLRWGRHTGTSDTSFRSLLFLLQPPEHAHLRIESCQHQGPGHSHCSFEPPVDTSIAGRLAMNQHQMSYAFDGTFLIAARTLRLVPREAGFAGSVPQLRMERF
jgi:hypothetical protein